MPRANGTDELVVTRFGVAPVKGLRMTKPESILLDETGAVGDRDFVVVDDADKVITVTVHGALVQLSAHYDPAAGRLAISSDDGKVLEDEVRLGNPHAADYYGMLTWPAREVLGPWNEQLSAIAGRSVRLLKLDQSGGASDVAPVTLLSDASLHELERRSGLGAIDIRRFRMLIHFSAPTPHVEDEWDGRIIEVGDVRLRVGGPVPRCAATTKHPEGGRKDAPIVKAIKDYRGMVETVIGEGVPFGVYAEVLQGGRVALGDTVHVLAEPPDA